MERSLVTNTSLPTSPIFARVQLVNKLVQPAGGTSEGNVQG